MLQGSLVGVQERIDNVGRQFVTDEFGDDRSVHLRIACFATSPVAVNADGDYTGRIGTADVGRQVVPDMACGGRIDLELRKSRFEHPRVRLGDAQFTGDGARPEQWLDGLEQITIPRTVRGGPIERRITCNRKSVVWAESQLAALSLQR